MRLVRVLAFVLVCILVGPTLVAVAQDRAGATDTATAAEIKRLQSAAKQLRDLAAEPRPERLTAEQEAAWKDYQAFLSTWAGKLDKAATKMKDLAAPEAEALAQSMQLQMQMAMERQQKLLSTLSNVMKRQQDTAQSIIDNLK